MYYTTDEVCKILKLSKSTVYKYIRNGQLMAYQMGKSYRISEEAIKDFMKGRIDPKYKGAKQD